MTTSAYASPAPAVPAQRTGTLLQHRPAGAPRVSVCIPTYRGEETIAATIDSVLAQSYADFELLVIDDGSPDATQAIVEGIADPRLVYLRNDRNLGPQGNWNRCLELARSDFVKVLPHDDLLRANCPQWRVQAFEAAQEERVAMVFCSRMVGPYGRAITRRGSVRRKPTGHSTAVAACGAASAGHQPDGRADDGVVPQIAYQAMGALR